MSDSVGLYLNEIGQVPLLNAEEERQLSQIIEKGRDAQAAIDAGQRPNRELRKAIADAAAAKDRFIRANLRLVVSVARRYPLPPSMELLDLAQWEPGLEQPSKFDWRNGFVLHLRPSGSASHRRRSTEPLIRLPATAAILLPSPSPRRARTLAELRAPPLTTPTPRRPSRRRRQRAD